MYPVPDGDTGTNMMMTVDSVVAELDELDADADLTAVTVLPGYIDTHVHIGNHFDDDGKVTIDYRPVHMYTLTDDVEVVPPKARVY